MAFTKIQTADMNGKGAMSLPDQPTVSASELKRKFDEPSKEVIVPKFNNLIDEMEATTAAADLGAATPTDRPGAGNTVQSVMNKLSTDLKSIEDNVGPAITDAHTHSNKALLDTYTQSDADIAQAIADDHTHSNKSLLDSYTQTNAAIAQAVTDDHTHSNKSLLDSYQQTETNLADAVSKKHAHSNQSLLDSYTQTEVNLADAVSKKHSHTNKTVIDKFGEDSGGNPTYDGNPIGGGGSASDTFKNIVSAGTTFVASGNNDTFKINAGSNVTITPLSSPDKGISISATGGGQSTGDMLMAAYDNDSSVKNASSTGNGIKDFVAAEIGKLDVSDSAVLGQYVSAVSETDGKISVTRANLPTITDTYSGTSSDGMSGKAVKSAIDALDGTVTGTAGAGNTLTAFSQTDGKVSATFEAISITKSQISDFPTIPTVNDATLTIQQNGTQVQTFTANAGSNATANIVTDDWAATATVSSGAVTFTGVNDSGNYAYKVFCNITSSSTNKNPTAQLSTISGEGTSNMSLTYTTDADNGATCKLRRIK